MSSLKEGSEKAWAGRQEAATPAPEQPSSQGSGEAANLPADAGWDQRAEQGPDPKDSC